MGEGKGIKVRKCSVMWLSAAIFSEQLQKKL